MGGKIWAESEGVGKGASFIFEIEVEAQISQSYRNLSENEMSERPLGYYSERFQNSIDCHFFP